VAGLEIKNVGEPDETRPFADKGQAAVAETSGVSVATLRKLQKAEPADRGKPVLMALSVTLGWDAPQGDQHQRPGPEPRPRPRRCGYRLADQHRTRRRCPFRRP
jgi:hypothetical protein